MEIREVRPGLYERLDTPKHVPLTREFAARIAEASECPALLAVIEEAIEEQERRAAVTRRPWWRFWRS